MINEKKINDMKYWRGLWAFRSTEDNGIICKQFIADQIADYLLQVGNYMVVISQWTYSDSPYKLQWFDWIRRIIDKYKSCFTASNSIITSSVEEYSSRLIYIYKAYGKSIKIRSLSGKDKLLMCDLGDVIWDECSAQTHMRDRALKVLRQNGIAVTIDEWTKEYQIVSSTSHGERFYRCVGRFANANVVDLVRRDILNDFDVLSDAEYIGLHPLREGILDVLFQINGKYDICFVANQPNKAYCMLQKYDIGIISPVWFLSCEMGLKKPDIKMFQNALEQMSAYKNYRDRYMLGNRKEMDLMPCASLDIKGILFLCENNIVKEDEIHAEFRPWGIAGSVSEIERILITK